MLKINRYLQLLTCSLLFSVSFLFLLHSYGWFHWLHLILNYFHWLGYPPESDLILILLFLFILTFIWTATIFKLLLRVLSLYWPKDYSWFSNLEDEYLGPDYAMVSVVFHFCALIMYFIFWAIKLWYSYWALYWILLMLF